MEEETGSVFSHRNQFRIHSITSYCDSHFGVFFAGVKDVCWRQQEEMVNTLLVGCFSLSV